MVAIVDNLKSVLAREFPESDLRLDVVGDPGRVYGMLVWPGFLGQDHADRQRRVWDLLRSNLTPDERSHVSAILTMAPEEVDE